MMMMMSSQAKIELKRCIFFRFSWFSVDTVSSSLKGEVQQAMMPDAFASNHRVEDLSHSSVKNPKHS